MKEGSEIPHFEGEAQFSPEQEEDYQKHTIVDFLRHGEASYVYSAEKRRLEGPLTTKGKEQVEAIAAPYAESIDPERELLVIWSSPLQRAVESAAILRRVLEEKGVLVLRQKEVETLAPTATKKEYIERFREIGFPKHFALWLEESESSQLPEGVEPASKMFDMTKRWIHYAQRAAETVNPERGKRLHLVAIGHETSVEGLMNTAFGTGIGQGGSVRQAEFLRLDFERGKGDFAVEFRGQRAKVRQDPDTREFEKVD